MKPDGTDLRQLLGVALLLAIGLVVSHRWFGKVRVWGKQRFFHLTGEEFLLLGLMLGPLGANLIGRETVASLEPFIGLGLGYVGFLYGMQFHRDELASVPPRYYGATLAQVLVCMAVLAAPAYWAVGRAGASAAEHWPLVLCLLATSVGTSTSFLFILGCCTTRLKRSPLFQFMRFSSVFDDLLGVALFGVALCLLRDAAGTALVSAVAVGLVSGLLLQLTSRISLSGQERLLFLVGIVLFSGGLAAYLRLSPIFTNLVAGVYFCHHGAERFAYHDLLLTLEKPLYLLMLVLAGVLWPLQLSGFGVLLAVYVVCRGVGKFFGGQAAAVVLCGRQGWASSFGLGLTAQSEMAVAMMVNLLVLYPEGAAPLVVSAVFVAVLVNDLLSSAYFAIRCRAG